MTPLKKLAIAVAAVATVATAQAADYVWRNVKIGGGGYIPNIIYSPLEKGVAYARTDMGGIYRWDAAHKTWLPLEDNQAETNYQGIESVAVDPVTPGRVYAAIGTYYRRPAAIFRSDDHGDHWQIFPVSFRMGGNEDGRNLGERLAIDPNVTNILYFGSRHDGLQISTDRGEHWSQVTSFPHKGVGAPADWRSHGGVSFVIIDLAGKKGQPSQVIYAGVADPGDHHLYRSTDAGKSWSVVPGEPASWMLPGQAKLSGGVLYITYTDSKGPYGASKGAVYSFNTRTGKWTDITPPKKGAYMGLDVDRQHPGTVVVATLDRDEIDGDSIYRSRDAGKHWTDLRDISVRDVSNIPWLKWGQKDAKFGWWITGVAIDPFDANRMAYTTGATIYATDELTKADKKQTLHWKPWVDGIEQTAVLNLISPPKGAHLLSGFGDIGGYTHFDLTTATHMHMNPLFTNTNNYDYAGLAPNVIVRSGTHEPHATVRTATLGLSTDFGKTWQPLYAPLPDGYTEKAPKKIGYNDGDEYIDAHIVVSADGAHIVVMTPEPVVTTDAGKNWNKIAGLPKGAQVVADKADAKTFYGADYVAGTFFISHDGAKNFAPLRAAGFPADIRLEKPLNREAPSPLIATPGKAGDLWFITQGRLFHSADNGKNFAHIKSDLNIFTFDFGKPALGSNEWSLYALGRKGDTFAIWQSVDLGKSWTRINDASSEYCRMFRTIAADKNVFGRVYVGIDGRGIIYGEPR